jgi:hypothetical protein
MTTTRANKQAGMTDPGVTNALLQFAFNAKRNEAAALTLYGTVRAHPDAQVIVNIDEHVPTNHPHAFATR